MAAPNELFRKSAIEKLSSPEQLDVMMEVTSPAAWIALVGMGVVLAFVCVWSVVGKVGIRVEGRGMLMRGATVLDVTTPAQGRLDAILVKPGDAVKPGQLVARLDQSELALKIEHTKAQLLQLEAERADMGAANRSLAAQYRAQLADLKERASGEEKLVAKGIITKSTLLHTKEQISQTEQLLAQTELGQSGKKIQVDDLGRQIREMEARLADSADVKANAAGRVLEITASVGGLVAPGTRLLTLEPLDAPLEAVLYVPATEGKKIQAGMEVRISPSTVKAEEYGFLLGKVRSVSVFPVTPEGLRKVLRNDRLAEEMIGSGAPIEVIAELKRDPATPSGFRWSSSKGPPTQVFGGTLATGSVVVEAKRPISYVLPVMKKSLGVS